MFQLLEFTEAKLTPERLRQVLHYDPETGIFTWRVSTSHRVKVGAAAGCLHKCDGRIYISIDGRKYMAHRLAWFYVHGAWPPAGIDHRDGVASHNWIDNLRPATQAENMQNLHAAHRDSGTGFLGVRKSSDGKYIARLLCRGARFEGKRRDTPEEAHADYLAIKAQHHPFATITRDHKPNTEVPPQSATTEVTIERSQPGTRTSRGMQRTRKALAEGTAS